MVGIEQNIVFGINRIKIVFADKVGNYKDGIGTGFWIGVKDQRIFITNKHNVDPTLKFGDTELELFSIHIELRKLYIQEDESVDELSKTDFFEVKNFENSLKISKNADCAILVAPEFELPEGYEVFILPDRYKLADDNFLRMHVHLMDPVSFIGFPGSKGKDLWYDTEWNLPIARNASIASFTWKSFRNDSIKTEDVILVSGLSFNGSSGSPVFLHQKGIDPSLIGRNDPYLSNVPDFPYVPPSIIGIMSGHFIDIDQTPAMFNHSGLSYFTTSKSIWELISTI